MNRYMYIIGTVCVLFVITTLFIKLLPFLIVAGIITYVVVKLKGKIQSKKTNEYINKNNFNSSKNTGSQEIYNSPDDYTNGEIIDVDYEDVDKN